MTTEQTIARAIEILTDEGVEEWGSWNGERGAGVSWDGDRSDGWRLLGEMMSRGLPIRGLRRVWHVLDGEVNGPRWEIEFSTTGES